MCRQQGGEELGLAVALLDGEEQLYTDTLFGPDGLYGSKHLAAAWADTPYNARWALWAPALLLTSANDAAQRGPVVPGSRGQPHVPS